MKAKTISLFLTLFLCGPMAAPSFAQDLRTVNVQDLVEVTFPSSWTLNDRESRERLAKYAQETMKIGDTHVASLEASNHPGPMVNQLRVSVLPLADPITQSELRAEVSANRQGVLDAVKESWAAEEVKLRAVLQKQGYPMVGTSSVAIESFKGAIVFAMTYVRKAKSTPDVRVTQYHALLGTKKAIITLSHVPSDAKARADHERVKASMRFF